MSQLRVQDLVVSLGERRLAPLSFTVGGGEILALTGPSGSGKTTALRTIAGLAPSAGGGVTLDGRDPREGGYPKFRRRVIYLAQEPVLAGDTVLDALARPFAYRVGAAELPRDRAQGLLEALGLEDVMGRDPGILSVGERQRIALARALLLDPAFLLADEPTSALDAGSVEATEAVLRRETARGLGIVLVSHDDAQRDRLAGRRVEVAS